MNAFQKVLAFIGLLGLGLLSPVIFYTFGNPAPINFMADKVGALGDPSVLTFVSFCMIGLSAFLGGGKNLSATLISFILGGLLISTAVDINFLSGFKSLATSLSFLDNPSINLLTGLGILLFGMFLSYAEKVNIWVEIIALVVLPAFLLIGANERNWFPEKHDFNISMKDGYALLSKMIDEKYLKNENVKKFVEEVNEDASLTEEEKKAKMEELKGKINKLEDDQKTLEELKKENEKYKEIIKSQEEQIKNAGFCAGAKDSSIQVKRFEQAVLPDQPCVRDFAVSLVKNQEGAYYDRSQLLPGEAGIRQICDLHYHLTNNWKYISDPTMIRNDYYSPAHRTIALGLAGDCDDFAILNASCVEAIGGVSRIMAGFCSGGGHGWAEVLIGDEYSWKIAVKRIRKHYKDPNKKIQPNIDKKGYYWLSLDWRMGEFSCNDNPNKMIELYSSADHFNK